MKLSDYIAEFFAERGLKTFFLVSGRAVVHLADSFVHHAKLSGVCAQHEQMGAAMAESYAKVTQDIGLMITTSGPGATNLTTSIANAYYDSIPLICLTGQISRPLIKKSPDLRQNGFQEVNLSLLFSSITKYTKRITDPNQIRYELEKAVYLAKEPRPGPVLLDIPADLEREEIDPERLIGFDPIKKTASTSSLVEKYAQLERLIHEAKRPVMILGAGIHQAGAKNELLSFLEKVQIPALLTWGGIDLLTENTPLNAGRIGVCGSLHSNFAVQNADLVIALGTRLSHMITGGNTKLFAPFAKKVLVDIDLEEAMKFDSTNLSLDLFIHADLKDFLLVANSELSSTHERFSSWMALINTWKKRYPRKAEITDKVDPYLFIQTLSSLCPESIPIACDTGANLCWTCQAFECKKGQRLISAWNQTPMGYSIPAAIGASLGLGQEAIALIGDGGFMMCLQELATIRRYNLPIRLFLFDNEGHGIQRLFMNDWLNSRYTAVDEPSGLYFPDYEKIADAFHLPYSCIENNEEMLIKLRKLMSERAPLFCRIKISKDQKIIPQLKFPGSLEEMDPKIPNDEIERAHREALELSFVHN